MKDPNKLEETKQLFHDFPINITVDGKRHLGASIGTAEFKNEYMIIFLQYHDLYIGIYLDAFNSIKLKICTLMK